MNLPQEKFYKNLEDDQLVELLENFTPLRIEDLDENKLPDPNPIELTLNSSNLTNIEIEKKKQKVDLDFSLDSQIESIKLLEVNNLPTSNPLVEKFDSNNLTTLEISNQEKTILPDFKLESRSQGFDSFNSSNSPNAVNSSNSPNTVNLSNSRNAVSSTFDIVINFSQKAGERLTSSQQEVFSQAEATWESIILGTQPGVNLTLTIEASAPAIDGAGKVLGSAGPTSGKTAGNFLFATEGRMRFDSSDIANLEAKGTFDDVILHEMAHVIGIGTLWSRSAVGASGFQELYTDGSGRYTGENALAAYKTEFNQPNATYVPVELDGGSGTANGHWDESASSNLDPYGRSFRDVLMTGFLDSNPFISKTTIGSLKDLGFVVAVPTITSDATANVSENQISAIDVNATDDRFSEGSGLTYSIRGGEDAKRFTINANTGELSFTKAPDFENPSDADGDNNYEIQVKVTNSQQTSINPDGDFKDIQDINIVVTNQARENTVPTITVEIAGNNQTVEIESYGKNGQDSPDSQVSSIENGSGVKIEGNGWKSINIGDYSITANTVLEFEFNSNSQGEIQGLALDDNKDHSDSQQQIFQLFGVQKFKGNQAFNNYQSSDGWKTYSIKVGDYFSGDIDRIGFVSDDDRANAKNISQFRNIRLMDQANSANVSQSANLSGDTINKIIGTKEADVLIGTPEDDWIIGDQDNDLLTGKGGRNVFVIAENQGTDTITDFTPEKDKIGLSGNLNYDNLTLSDSLGNTIISSGENTLAILTGMNSSQITSTDLINV